MPSVTLNRLTGYRRSQRGRQRRPIIRSIRTLRIRQTYGLDFSTAASISPFPAATMLTPTGIFMNFRGPSALNGRLRKARSLRYPTPRQGSSYPCADLSFSTDSAFPLNWATWHFYPPSFSSSSVTDSGLNVNWNSFPRAWAGAEVVEIRAGSSRLFSTSEVIAWPRSASV